jgi:hypothetical protein
MRIVGVIAFVIAGMTQHQDRVRAILLVHALEADRRCSSAGSDGADLVLLSSVLPLD